jgi:hypothetical protein
VRKVLGFVRFHGRSVRPAAAVVAVVVVVVVLALAAVGAVVVVLLALTGRLATSCGPPYSH